MECVLLLLLTSLDVRFLERFSVKSLLIDVEVEKQPFAVLFEFCVTDDEERDGMLMRISLFSLDDRSF